jgi:hypothetical protein
MKISELFEPEPARWGLRGDPFLWRAMSEHLAETDLPDQPEEAGRLLHAAFAELTGVDLVADSPPSVYLERYAHGGMSSGMICLDTWRQQLMPMLIERATGVARDQAR